MSNTTTEGMAVRFAALNRYLESNIVKPIERETRGSMDYVSWGDGNRYPDYLDELYNEVPTLKTCIDGVVDYVCGDDIRCAFPVFGGQKANRKENGADVVKAVAEDLARYGGFALQVIRAVDGSIAEVYHVSMSYLRMNKDKDVFYYCEGWSKSNATRKALVYPAFNPQLEWLTLDDKARERNASSILYISGTRKSVYPSAKYAASVKACEMERRIDDYHLNALANGFSGNIIINFNNGVPDDETKDEIEEMFTEKFTGSGNAGRVAFSWNGSKENAMTVDQIETKDFGEKYNTLEKRARQQIFTAFRANPNLFGIPTESLGFSSEEYESAFKLFNRTTVQPMQKTIADAFAKVFGSEVITFVPFTMNGAQKAIQ